MTDHSASGPGGPSDIEGRLRHTLTAKATSDAVDPPDWGAFAGRLASATRRRQRLLVGAAALALVVGGAGGYFGEAAASPGQVAARATRVGAIPSTTVGGGGSRSVAPLAGGPEVMCPNESIGLPGTTPATTSTTVGPDAGGSGDIGSDTRLFIRTTADGVTVRAYENAPTAVSCLGGPIPQAGSGSTASSSATSGSPPAPLVPTGTNVTVELSDDDAVGQGAISSLSCVESPGGGAAAGSGTGSGSGGAAGSSVAVPPEPTNGPVVTPATTTPTAVTPLTTPVVSPPPTSPVTAPPVTAPPATSAPTSQPQAVVTGTFGVAEGDPVWWVAVEVGSDVTSVQMTFPDGTTDQMAPVGGVAVLAHRMTAPAAAAGTGPYAVRGTLRLLGTGGAVLSTVTLPQESTRVPSPTPEPAPLNEGAQSVSPGVILACPSPTINTPQAQSSGTTEKR